MKKSAGIIVLILAIVVILWHRSSRGATEKPDITYSYCPPTSIIKKNPVKRTWYAFTQAGAWKSYTPSFATELTKFLGAEWHGANIGQVFCVYASKQKFRSEGKSQEESTLNVVLAFHTLTLVPQGALWIKNESGLRLCKAKPGKLISQQDCPFTPNQKPKIGNIIQEAESLKKN